MAGEHRPGTVDDRLSTYGHPALTARPLLPTRFLLGAALLLTALFALALVPPSALAVNTPVRALVTIDAKTYDGSAAAAGTCRLVAPDGNASSTTLADTTCAVNTGSGASGAPVFANKDVGTGKTVTVTASNLTLGGTTCTGSNACTIADGQITNQSGATPITANITAKTVTVTTSASNRTYDGGTAAPGTTCTVSGGVESGDGPLSCTVGSATFATKDVADGKTVTSTGMTLSGTGSSNYVAPASSTTTANITKKNILPSVTASNREYDGTNNASASCSLTFSPTGNNPLTAVTGDNVTCGVTAAEFIAGAAVGNNKAVNVTGLTLGGTAAGNYSLSPNSGSTTANITAKVLTPTITAANKTYDGNANVTGTPTCTFASGVVGSEVVTCGIGSISFANKNVGTNKTVTASGLTLGGANAANYALSATTATTTANITAKTLTPTLVTPNKIYDGNTTATGTTCTFSTGQVITGDSVTCTPGSATFANKNVGTAKAVTITGLALTGTDAANYALSATTGSATANITAKALTATLTTPNKVYDGTTAAPGTTCTFSTGQVVTGDTVTCTVGGSTFVNKNAGTAKAVNVTGLALSGADATNYSLPATGSTTANITPKPATVTSTTAASRPYDGTVQAVIDNCVLTGLIIGDTVTCTGTGQFADPDVGLAKPVTVNSIVLGGTDGANYSTQAPYPATTGAITPKLVTATIQTPNKVFNGSAAAPGTTCTVTPGQVLPADVVSCLVGSASFNSAAVGNDKPVTATGLTLEGLDSPNYAVDPPTATTTASILAVPEVRIKREVFKRGRATFYFASQVRPNQAEYRCSFDGRAFRRCSSPQAYSGLKAGRRYTFRVRATLLGETGPVSRVTWRQAR